MGNLDRVSKYGGIPIALVIVIMLLINSYAIGTKIIMFATAASMLLPLIENKTIRFIIGIVLISIMIFSWWKFWA